MTYSSLSAAAVRPAAIVGAVLASETNCHTQMSRRQCANCDNTTTDGFHIPGTVHCPETRLKTVMKILVMTTMNKIDEVFRIDVFVLYPLDYLILVSIIAVIHTFC